jgi:hypothetical protein
MARHPNFTWTILSGWVPGEDLRIELHPLAWPERVATVQVNSGAEVFRFSFAGHVSHELAYRDDDRPETLQERIDHAAEATSGPTRVIRDCAGEITVRSKLVVDPDGPHPRPDGVSYPLRRLKARLRGSRITREVADFPAAPSS